MVPNPELQEFRRRIDLLRRHKLIRPHLKGDLLELKGLSKEDVTELLKEKDRVAYYFLIAAANLNRTSVKRAMQQPEARIVASAHRRTHVIQHALPHQVKFEATAEIAVALRAGDFGRKDRGTAEQLFRDRLTEEGIPILMSPPIRAVPALLVPRRKPDGVFPDPAQGKPPRIYLEVKNVQRVSDDIQKRLYEIAEAAIEMKALYGDLTLRGLSVDTTIGVAGNPSLRRRIRKQVTASGPVVVALLLCSKDEAERFREGAETFIDRVFFQEEIEECIAFLKKASQVAPP